MPMVPLSYLSTYRFLHVSNPQYLSWSPQALLIWISLAEAEEWGLLSIIYRALLDKSYTDILSQIVFQKVLVTLFKQQKKIHDQ